MKEVCVREVQRKEDCLNEGQSKEFIGNKRMKMNSRRTQIQLATAMVVLLVAAVIVLGSGSHTRLASQAPVTTPTFPLQTTASTSHAASQTPPVAQARFKSILSGLPLFFEPNVGQSGAEVKFLARGMGAHGLGDGVFLTSDGIAMTLRHRADSPTAPQAKILRMKLAGANPQVQVSGLLPLAGRTNYFLGNNPSLWHQDVPQFARVRYEQVYPGIDLVFYGNHGQMEYDFQVAPGADPARAELQMEGAKQVELKDGDLILHAEQGSVRLQAPRVYQTIGDRQQPVEAHFEMRAANRVGFALGAYDRSRELIIDPVLDYATYFGGSGDEENTSIAADNIGDIYLAGSTTSTNLPATTGVVQTTLKGAQNVYVVKINPQSGTSGIVYLTYLGGTGTDTPAGLAVDGGGNAYIAGTTSSANFPVTAANAYQAAIETGSQGTTHVFVTALNTAGTALNYSSYLSGNGTDAASGMAIDAAGNVYVTGTTTSTDKGTSSDQFPASAAPEPQAFQLFSRAPLQFFVTKVNTSAFGIGSIAYSTYFGGGTPSNGIALGGGVTVDGTGNIYFSGTTNFLFTGQSSATDFPILDAYQPCLDQPPPTDNTLPQSCTYNPVPTATDAFVAKINPNAPAGQQLIWSTYLGGSQNDSSTGVAIDTGASSVYLVGTTNSTDVTTLSSFAAYQICLDTPKNPATGTAGCVAPPQPAPTDAYVAKLTNAAATTGTTTTALMTLSYFSYVGGSANDTGLAIAVDSASDALITGATQSTDLCAGTNPCAPGVGESTLTGAQNAFFAHLNTTTVSGQTTVAGYATYFGGSGTDQGTSVAVDANENTYFAGDTNSPNVPTAKSLQSTNNGGFDAFAVKLGTAADLSITGVITLATNQTYVSAGNQATFTYTVTNAGPDIATQITVSDDFSSSTTQIPVTFVSATAGSGTCSTTTSNSIAVCTIPELQVGSTSTVTFNVTPSTGGSFNGGTVTVFSPSNTDPNPGNNTVTVSAKASDYTMAISPANQSILAAGDTAKYTVTVSPSNPYSASIALSTSGQPTGATPTFSVSSVTLPSASPVSSQLSITTAARPISTTSNKRLRQFYALWLSLPGMAVIGFGWKTSRRRRIAATVAACLLFGLILFQPACGGSTTPTPVSGTPPGTYTLTLTATSGTDTKNTTFTLTVP